MHSPSAPYPPAINHEDDIRFMNRALQLARGGLGNVSPNPMVGAVIVNQEKKIIGEGYHRRFGEAHAEVNAVKAIKEADKSLIRQSTIYVTLEPCAHFGKTPPCAQLLVQEGFKRVVIGTKDPFDKVSGRGIDILREAGIHVSVGVLEDECQSLNARFFTAHKLHRPFITLKWAQSNDRGMDCKRASNEGAMKFSTFLGTTLVHRLRANHDAIGVGSGTVIADSPRLDVRHWHGNNPQRVVFDRRGRVGTSSGEIEDVLKSLYDSGITSILVEGGSTLIRSFIDKGLWDLARVEVAPFGLGSQCAVLAPTLPNTPFATRKIETHDIYYYSNNPLVNKYFIDNGL